MILYFVIITIIMENKVHFTLRVIIIIVSTEAAAQSVTIPGITNVNNIRNLFPLLE